MSDTRPCPSCGATIKAAAVLCRFCREPIPKHTEALNDAELASITAAASFTPQLSPGWLDSAPWIGASRLAHWIGVAAFSAFGVVALAKVEVIHMAYMTLAVLISTYLYGVVLLQALRASYRAAAPALGLYDIVEVACIASVLSFTTGFWLGFADVGLDYGSSRQGAYWIAIWLFSGVVGFALLLGTLAALIRIAAAVRGDADAPRR